MNRVSVIIPTLNEAANLARLVEGIIQSNDSHGLDMAILVIDDGSFDGTIEIANELSRHFPVSLIQRHDERGLASAVVCGMRQATGDALVVLDADGSHPFGMVGTLAGQVLSDEGGGSKFDIAIGSRYVVGGSTSEDWSLLRKLMSRFSSVLARPLTDVRDPLSGMFAVSRDLFERVSPCLKPSGFKILLELLAAAPRASVAELPIRFAERIGGESKLTARVALEYVQQLARLYAARLWRPYQHRSGSPVNDAATRCVSANPRGFTIVELLVVIAIFALLMALLLPAVNAAREAARRTTCSLQMRNLGLAVQHYHGANNGYPTNRFKVPEDVGPDGRSWSWITKVMPFIEEQPLYDQLDIRRSTLGEKADLISRPNGFLLCPSSGDQGTRKGAGDFEKFPIGTTNYKAVCGANWGADETQGQEDIGSSWRNIGFNGSYDGQAHGDGIMWRDDNDKRMNANRIMDGLSHTFLLGEDIAWKNYWNSWSYNTHVFGTCAIPLNMNDVDPTWWAESMGFRSFHPAGAHFCYADGSVRFIAADVDAAIYVRSATRRDRQ